MARSKNNAVATSNTINTSKHLGRVVKSCQRNDGWFVECYPLTSGAKTKFENTQYHTGKQWRASSQNVDCITESPTEAPLLSLYHDEISEFKSLEFQILGTNRVYSPIEIYTA